MRSIPLPGVGLRRLIRNSSTTTSFPRELISPHGNSRERTQRKSVLRSGLFADFDVALLSFLCRQSLAENCSNNGDSPMNTITGLELSTDVRRRLLGLLTLTAAAIVAIGFARAESGAARPASFGPLKQ